MELKSLAFVVFAAVVIGIYYGVRKIAHAQKYVLLAANLFFIYLVSGKKGLFIIALLTAAVYGLGIRIEKTVKDGKKETARNWMYLGVFLCVGILCYFKFFRDTYEILQAFLQQRGISLETLLTPVGMSYYTLSMIAYLIDIYHKKHPAEKNYLDLVAFVTYFPAIIQGPINLYRKLAPQLKQSHTPDADRIIMGAQRSLWGYFKKVVVADRIGILVMGILQDEASAGVLIFWAMVLYSFQIYTDFSGGIDVIMGVSEMLDIKLVENFKAPLVSRSVTEYWQRWHMSLGEFMEKYIYYPIVLNRRVMKFSKKIPSKYLQKTFSATLASVIVFVIVGIWHGTGWNYVVYGCYQALFVSSAVLLAPVYKHVKQKLKIDEQCISWRIFTTLRTFGILVFGRYFIKAGDLGQTWELFSRTFRTWNIHVLFDDTLFGYGLDERNLYLMYVCILLVILVDVLHDRGIHFREKLMRQDIVFRYGIYFLGIFFIIILGIYGAEYSAATFIYQGF